MLILRYMQMQDIEQVAAIDAASFDPPWPARSYAYEISESTYSYMATLELEGAPSGAGWRGLLGRLRRPQRLVVGYGGLWNVADEAHISTIATHPDYRGRYYGEILLAGMVRRALALQAAYVVLEVRMSNRVAQSLYAKYGFRTCAVKSNYYRNNNEDAYDMRIMLDDADAVARLHALYDDIRRRTRFVDLYSDYARPEL